MITKFIIPILLAVSSYYSLTKFLARGTTISILLSIITFILSRKIITKIILARTKSGKKTLLPTEEKAQIVADDGISRLKQVRSNTSKISNNDVASKIQEICKVGLEIFKNIKEHPEDLRKARQFTNYYLDATENIVQKYIELSPRREMSPEIGKSLEDVESSLDMIKSTYDKQLANLMTNDVLDLNTEITVLKKTIKLEG